MCLCEVLLLIFFVILHIFLTKTKVLETETGKARILSRTLFFTRGKEHGMKKESSFQASLIRKLKNRFPDCVVLKTDPNYIQGFPDLLILHGGNWAALECKRESGASRQPNQDYYICRLGKMGYASFVYPENEKEVLNGIQQAFQSGGAACLSEPE